MATGPTVRRRRLGTELRKLRESCGYKLEEVAALLGVAPSTLSRIETGKAPTKSLYLNQLLEMYGVTDTGQRQILVDMAREGHRKGWWAAYDDVLPSGLDIYVGLEAEASGLRSYEISVVHGLLQTQDYARAVLTATTPGYTATQIDRLVDLRMERQRRLYEEPPLELWVIHDEAVILRTVGGPAVMHRQLAHLLAAAGRPCVTQQVLPCDGGAHAGHDGAFSIIEFDDRPADQVVYAESAAGSLYLEKDKDVRIRTEAFERLRAAALPPRASLDVISKAARELALTPVGHPADGGAGVSWMDRQSGSTDRRRTGWKSSWITCTGSRAVSVLPGPAWRSRTCPAGASESATPKTAARLRTSTPGAPGRRSWPTRRTASSTFRSP